MCMGRLMTAVTWPDTAMCDLTLEHKPYGACSLLQFLDVNFVTSFETRTGCFNIHYKISLHLGSRFTIGNHRERRKLRSISHRRRYPSCSMFELRLSLQTEFAPHRKQWMTHDIRCSVRSSATTRTCVPCREHCLMARNHKSTYVLVRSVRYFRSILTTNGFPRKIFENPRQKCYKNPSNMNRVIPCEQTDRHWDNGHFSRILHTHTDGHMSRDISCFCNFPTLLQYHILHKRVACPVREILSIAKCV